MITHIDQQNCVGRDYKLQCDAIRQVDGNGVGPA
jgi:hypothetical protein